MQDITGSNPSGKIFANIRLPLSHFEAHFRYLALACVFLVLTVFWLRIYSTVGQPAPTLPLQPSGMSRVPQKPATRPLPAGCKPSSGQSLDTRVAIFVSRMVSFLSTVAQNLPTAWRGRYNRRNARDDGGQFRSLCVIGDIVEPVEDAEVKSMKLKPYNKSTPQTSN
jgi:hypothetical protein